MVIHYKSNKLQKQLGSPKAIIKSYGQRAKKVKQRIDELIAANNLGIMRTLPAANCHELTGNRKGELAVDVSGNFRLIFEPYHDPIPEKEDGGLDWDAVTEIQIVEIGDYH